MMSRYRDSFLIGYSHPKASYFLLRRQKKVAKEKAARSPPMSCAPRTCALWGIYRATAEWASCPSAAVRHPCRNLYALGCFGLFPTNTPVLDAANGRKARYCVTSVR